MTKSVVYQIDIVDVAGHIVDITLSFTPDQCHYTLTLPCWIPGSYMIRDFARNIVSISAFDCDGALTLQQLDKQSWRLDCRQHKVSVHYQVYAYDLSVRAAYIDDEIAVLNPASLCLKVSQLAELPHILNIKKPAYQGCESWRVATALSPQSNTAQLGFGHYHAQNYDELIDSPVIAGIFNLSEFVIDAVPHYLVVTGNNLTDQPQFTADLQQICQQQKRVFNELPADLKQYWFLLWVTEDGYGGLEHKNSTLLLCSRNCLPPPKSGLTSNSDIEQNYQDLLALCSHEYFHNWWVKRLKPACFTLYQLNAEQYTNQLWLYEGFTSYYDDLALVRSGLISHQRYIATLEKLISRVTRTPNNTKQSLADSSFNAWTKFYKQDENASNAIVSYYAKGALLALCLEAELTAAGSCLDNVVQQLWQDYLQSGTPDDALPLTLKKMGFTDLALQVETWVHQPSALPLQETLLKLGLSVKWRPMQHSEDLGGVTELDQPYIGIQTKVNQSLLQLTQVYHGSSAHRAGLMVGDQLLAVDGRKITAGNWPDLLRRLPLNCPVQLSLFRKDRLLQLPLILTASQHQVAELTVSDDTLCRKWLTSALID